MSDIPSSSVNRSRDIAAKIAIYVGLAGLDLIRLFFRLIFMIAALVIALMIVAMLLDHIYMAGAHEDVFVGLFYALRCFLGPITLTIFLYFFADRVISNNLSRECLVGCVGSARGKSQNQT